MYSFFSGGVNMYEKLSWNMFLKTGSIDQYLLYKEMQNSAESDKYGIYKNDGSCPKTENG